MTKISAYVAFAFAVVASPAAFANHIGPAGCGLGNSLFHKDNQVLAATTNGSSYNQMFGITSGTSGCVENQEMAMVMFVEGNRFALSNEAARGKGETIEALAKMMGCSESAEVAHALKSNYGEIFDAHRDNSIAMTKSIQSAVAPVCRRVG